MLIAAEPSTPTRASRSEDLDSPSADEIRRPRRPGSIKGNLGCPVRHRLLRREYRHREHDQQGRASAAPPGAPAQGRSGGMGAVDMGESTPPPCPTSVVFRGIADPSPKLNRDNVPLPPSRRTWGAWSYVGFWVTTGVNISGWTGGSSLLALGLSVGQAMAVVCVGQILVAAAVICTGLLGAEWHVGFPMWNRVCVLLLSARSFLLLAPRDGERRRGSVEGEEEARGLTIPDVMGHARLRLPPPQPHRALLHLDVHAGMVRRPSD